jgi:hypothetical protein
VRIGLEPDVAHFVTSGVAQIHLDLTAVDGPVGVFGAEHRLLDGDGPDIPLTAEQGAQAANRGKKVAAVLLHHRQ